MKSYKEIEKKYSPKELAESYVFPNELNSSERQESLEFFQKWRKKNESNRLDKSRLISQLLQLKFVMEDHIDGRDLGGSSEPPFFYPLFLIF